MDVPTKCMRKIFFVKLFLEVYTDYIYSPTAKRDAYFLTIKFYFIYIILFLSILDTVE